jgi:hypothetical protein
MVTTCIVSAWRSGEISTIMMIKNSKIGLVRLSKVIYSFIVISICAVESLETQKERMGGECSLLRTSQMGRWSGRGT